MTDPMSLDGKFALVTGSSSGIGLKIAEKLLESGVRVGAHYFSNRKGAAKLVDLVGKERCRLFKADFFDSRHIMQLWSDFLDWSGTISILVNNAGIASNPMALDDLREDAWDRTFQVNLKAPFLLSQAALSVMKENSWGRIINIGSIGVKFGGGEDTAHYSVSKSALETLTIAFAKRGAPYNVLVNAIRVGVTDTPFHRKIGRANLSGRVDLIPLKRMAQPDEIANTVRFLASEDSSYVTGSILTVAGGE